MKFSVATASAIAVQASAALAGRCHSFPGDASWPLDSAWSALNSTVGGRLVATVAIGSPCHDPNYNATACALLQTEWTLPQTQ